MREWQSDPIFLCETQNSRFSALVVYPCTVSRDVTGCVMRFNVAALAERMHRLETIAVKTDGDGTVKVYRNSRHEVATWILHSLLFLALMTHQLAALVRSAFTALRLRLFG